MAKKSFSLACYQFSPSWRQITIITNPLVRPLAALIGAFILWKLVRSFQNGVIYDRGSMFSLEDQPMQFTLLAIVHGLIMAFFFSRAAGYDLATFWRWIVGE